MQAFPSIESLQLLKSGEPDISVIADLAYTIWNEYYPSIITQDQVNYMLNKMYSAEALKTQMQEGQEFYLIHAGSIPVGFLSVSSLNKTDWMLHKFYVHSQQRKKGIGSIIFNLLIETLNHPETVRLTVNRHNYQSINFYFKNGFTIERVADFDIGDGYFMNDFVMLWHKKTIH